MNSPPQPDSSRPQLLVALTVALICVCAVSATAADIGVANDCSGSMEGEKALAARAAIGLIAAIADDGQRLAVIPFSSEASRRDLSLTSISDRDGLGQWLGAIPIEGATDYMAALRLIAIRPPQDVIFLSDGEHTEGPSDAVVEYAKRHLAGRCRLHTLAIECAPDSEAENLLREMAALTGGSFTAVNDSEQLVRTIVSIAVGIGDYRSYTPHEQEVRLQAAPGRLLAFAYDGDVNVDSPGTTTKSSSHRARLPGEDVAVSVIGLQQPGPVTIRLINSRTSGSRLGDVHVDYLARATSHLSTSNGRLPAGGTAPVRITLQNPDGTDVDLRQQSNISGQVDVLDHSGSLLASRTAEPTSDGAALVAEPPLPTVPGPVIIRSTTVVLDDGGIPFRDVDEQQVLVEEPHSFQVAPAKLTAVGTPGTITMACAGTVDGEALDPERIAVRLAEAFDGGEFLGMEVREGELWLKFDVPQPGKYAGTLTVRANADVPTLPVEVPFALTIVPRYRGLSLQSMREYDLGTRLAQSGAARLQFRVTSFDDEPLEYVVDVADLASDQGSIPLAAVDAAIAPTSDSPAILTLTALLGDVPAGEYSTTLTLATEQLSGKQWSVNLRLKVTEPLTAGPIDLGAVEVGSRVDFEVELRNRGSNRLTEVMLSSPTLFSSENDGETRDVVMATEIEPLIIDAEATRRIPLAVVVAPDLALRGALRGELSIRRGQTQAVSVPVILTVVDEGQGPAPFVVGTEKVTLRGRPGDVLQFEIPFRANQRTQGEVALDVTAGDLQDDQGNDVDTTLEFQWSADQILTRSQRLTAKGYLIAPQEAGTYGAELTISSSRGGRVQIPIHVTVN